MTLPHLLNPSSLIFQSINNFFLNLKTLSVIKALNGFSQALCSGLEFLPIPFQLIGLQAPHSVTATLQCLPSAHFRHSMPVLALTEEGRGDSWHFIGYWKSDHPCEICHTATNFWKAKWWLYVCSGIVKSFISFVPPSSEWLSHTLLCDENCQGIFPLKEVKLKMPLTWYLLCDATPSLFMREHRGQL